MDIVLFSITALIAIIGAVAMLLSKNAVHSALFLLMNFGAIAVLYLLLHAPFLFAVQLIVYAGAIIVLFLFVVMLLGAERAEDGEVPQRWQLPLAIAMAVILFGQMAYVLLRNVAPVASNSGDFGAPEKVAAALFTSYLLPFEVTSMVILAATIGVVVLHLPEKRSA